MSPRWYAIKENSYSWAGSGSVDGNTWFKTYDVQMMRKLGTEVL